MSSTQETTKKCVSEERRRNGAHILGAGWKLAQLEGWLPVGVYYVCIACKSYLISSNGFEPQCSNMAQSHTKI